MMKTKTATTLKIILLMVSTLTLLGMVSSCTMESDVEEATITLSATDGMVRFSKEASEQVVTVDATSSSPWGLISNGEWMEATKDGNNLIIKVQENPLPESRQATVVITAGRATAKITVVQESGDLAIGLLPSALNVDQLGGDFVVDVVSNTYDWQAESDVEWVEVTSLPYSQEIKLTVKPTKERKERVGTIHFINSKNSGSNTELIIKQEAVMWFDLPYLDFENGDITKIREFELNRHSITASGWLGFENFTTISSPFPMTTYYSFTSDGTAFVKARMYARDKSVLEGEQLEEFIEYLKEQGFTDQNLPYAARLFHPEKKIAVQIRTGVNLPNYGDPHVAFIYTPDQPEPHKTFPSIEEAIGFQDFASGHEAVAAYEAARGGVLTEGEINAENPTPERQYYEREMPDGTGTLEIIYWYEWADDGTSTVTNHRRVYAHPGYMYWTYNGLFGYVTDEFRKLSQEAGYVELPYILFQERRGRAFLNPNTGWQLMGAHFYNWRTKTNELWLDSFPIGGGHTHGLSMEEYQDLYNKAF